MVCIVSLPGGALAVVNGKTVLNDFVLDSSFDINVTKVRFIICYYKLYYYIKKFLSYKSYQSFAS